MQLSLNSINNNMNISELEQKFNEFKQNNTIDSLKITETIKMMELDNIKDMVLDAKAKIESYTFGMQTGFLNKTKFYSSHIPLIGNALKSGIEKIQRKQDENSNISEVFKNLFENFSIKQDRILELMEMLENMGMQIQGQFPYLQEIVEITQNIIDNSDKQSEIFKAKRLNEMANTTILKNNDKLENKIKPGIMLAMKSLDNMNKILPSLQSDMIDELGINGALNSFKDVNNMLRETMELAITITEASSRSTENLMLEVMEIADTSNNLKYIEEAQKRRKSFSDKFEKALIESNKNQEKNYQKIKDIAQNYQKNETLSAMLESYSDKNLSALEYKKDSKIIENENDNIVIDNN